MILSRYTFTLVNISCLPSSTLFNAIVELDGDLTEVLPFLNATITGGHYQHKANTFDFTRDGHIITILPRQMKVTGVRDREHAAQVIDGLVGQINDVWSRRGEISPVLENRTLPGALELLRALPRTNCGDCGEPTCLAFAVKLSRGSSTPSGCPWLGEERRLTLEGALRSSGITSGVRG